MTPEREPIVIGLGGNIGGDAAIIERFGHARAAIGMLGEIRAAALYRTEPMGPAQPAFLNTALRLIAPGVVPAELIATLLEIEHLLGRRRDEEARWGPRAIDLDVLVWGARVVATPELAVPHPRLFERRFALAPLVELLGERFELPGGGPAGAALAALQGQRIEQIAERW